MSKEILAKIEASIRENRQQAISGMIGMVIMVAVVLMVGEWVGKAYQRKQHKVYSGKQNVSWVITATKGEMK